MSRRRRSGYRVYGPYLHGRRWHVLVVDPEGARDLHAYDDEAAAQRDAEVLREAFAKATVLTIREAVDAFELYLRARGLKPRSVARIRTHLEEVLELEEPIRGLTAARAEKAYEKAQQGFAVDTHRNALSVAKRWSRWCTARGWLLRDPFVHVEPEGIRSRGKEQLSAQESYRYMRAALALAAEGREGAVAALMPLLLGLRSGEVRSMLVRHVSDNGKQMAVAVVRGKTRRARRTIGVPTDLARALRRLLAGRDQEQLVFLPLDGATRCDHWMQDQVDAVLERAGIAQSPPGAEGGRRITSHCLRGTFATLAEQSQVPVDQIVRLIGHAGRGVLRAHYSDPSAVETAAAERTFKVIAGGKKERKRSGKRSQSVRSRERGASK